MAQIRSKPFGVTKEGANVTEYILSNPDGLKVHVLDYGCIIKNIIVPTKNGPVDVVLGHDTMADYEKDFTSSSSTCCGAFVGRYANRIENAVFSVGGKTYQLKKNCGEHHLHGTFPCKLYRVKSFGDTLLMETESPDGEDGFPGNLKIAVRYTLTEDNAFRMDYRVSSDADTLINLTNHSYFNLDGGGDVLNQKLRIYASNYLEGNNTTCPTGNILPVAGTPMDFRVGKLIGREHFHVTIGAEDTKKEVLSTFISQYYAGTPFVPKEIMLPMEIDDANVVAEWLSAKRGQKVYIRVPKKGQREKLVELAEQNAVMVLTQDKEKIRREEGRTIGAVKEIADLLDLGYVKRMEAYDISNTNGFESVGSMVVYERGKPCRSDYRKFKLKTVTGPDDYASMREVLTRRFTHGMEERAQNKEKNLAQEYGSFTKFPDLILMDGGKGQVNIALEVLDELKLAIPVCGMVKDDHHRTRGLYFNNEEIPIDRHSEGFRLITRIQDEAHRFAIEYHRSLRSKQQVRSILDDIPNIGETRRKALMRQFQSLEKIREASVEQLREVDGMNEKAAQSVYQFFHKE